MRNTAALAPLGKERVTFQICVDRSQILYLEEKKKPTKETLNLLSEHPQPALLCTCCPGTVTLSKGLNQLFFMGRANKDTG